MAIKSRAPHKQSAHAKKTYTHYKYINLLITAHNLNEHYLTNETAVYIVFAFGKNPTAQLQIGNIDAIHTQLFFDIYFQHTYTLRSTYKVACVKYQFFRGVAFEVCPRFVGCWMQHPVDTSLLIETSIIQWTELFYGVRIYGVLEECACRLRVCVWESFCASVAYEIFFHFDVLLFWIELYNI